MDKHTVPEDFTLTLALVDAIPVLFFAISCILIGRTLHSPLFIVGAALCLFAGACKVLWKIIVVLKKKNIWFLFVQMRRLMPAGFLIMVISVIILPQKKTTLAPLLGLFSMPSLLFVLLWVLGMVLMGVFAKKLDNKSKKANWIEQITNGVAQICFTVALLLL